MDWLEIPNLRGKALSFWGGLVWRTSAAVTDVRLRRIYFVYGLLAIAYAGFIALTVFQLYQRFIEVQLARLLPAVIAAGVGWTSAGLMAGLVLYQTWREIRDGTKPRADAVY